MGFNKSCLKECPRPSVPSGCITQEHKKWNNGPNGPRRLVQNWAEPIIPFPVFEATRYTSWQGGTVTLTTPILSFFRMTDTQEAVVVPERAWLRWFDAISRCVRGIEQEKQSEKRNKKWHEPHPHPPVTSPMSPMSPMSPASPAAAAVSPLRLNLDEQDLPDSPSNPR